MERSAWPKNLSSSRKHAIQELLHGQNPTKKLRDLFDAHSQTGNDTGQPLFAEDLVANALRSFSNTLSLSSGADSYEVLQVPTNACVMSEVSQECESIKTPVPRKTSDTRTRLDQNLIDDGHQQRTFDQKSIINSELPGESIDDDALKWRMEIEERLHRQLEVQKKLQLRIEDQGKYLQAIVQQAYFNLHDDLNKSNMMMYERGGPQNHGSASPIYEGEAATLVRSSSNLPQLILDSPSPGDDSIPLSFNSNPVFFDFLSVNQEQMLPGEDDLNPHGHSHDRQ